MVDTLPCDHGQSDVDLIDVAHPDLGNRAVDGTPVGALGQIAKTSRAAIVIAGRGETHVGALLEQRFFYRASAGHQARMATCALVWRVCTKRRRRNSRAVRRAEPRCHEIGSLKGAWQQVGESLADGLGKGDSQLLDRGQAGYCDVADLFNLLERGTGIFTDNK